LLGVHSKIREINALVKNADRPTCLIPGDGGKRNNMWRGHTVLRVTTKAGEDFAIDITGAQYGWQDTFAIWDVYQNRRIRTVVSEYHFPRKYSSDPFSKRWDSKYQKTFEKVHEKTIRAFDLRWELWLRKEGLTAKDFLELSEENFGVKKRELLDDLRSGFAKSIKLISQTHPVFIDSSNTWNYWLTCCNVKTSLLGRKVLRDIYSRLVYFRSRTPLLSPMPWPSQKAFGCPMLASLKL
jgi:hypothetical protein